MYRRTSVVLVVMDILGSLVRKRQPTNHGSGVARYDAGGSSSTNCTWMFPRVALLYGQRWCARSTNASAAARSMPGRRMCSATVRAYVPSDSGPMPTRAVISDCLSGVHPVSVPNVYEISLLVWLYTGDIARRSPCFAVPSVTRLS